MLFPMSSPMSAACWRDFSSLKQISCALTTCARFRRFSESFVGSEVIFVDCDHGKSSCQKVDVEIHHGRLKGVWLATGTGGRIGNFRKHGWRMELEIFLVGKSRFHLVPLLQQSHVIWIYHFAVNLTHAIGTIASHQATPKSPLVASNIPNSQSNFRPVCVRAQPNLNKSARWVSRVVRWHVCWLGNVPAWRGFSWTMVLRQGWTTRGEGRQITSIVA